MTRPRVAIAHDYLTQRGGAERVVLAMHRAFPEATIHTTLYDPEGTYPDFRTPGSSPRASTTSGRCVGTTARRCPSSPRASSRLRIDADVVLVSSSGWAHGFDISGRPLIYCHAPARWLYQPVIYLGGPMYASWRGLALAALRPFLVRWDRARPLEPTATSATRGSCARGSRRRTASTRRCCTRRSASTAEASLPRSASLADWADSGFLLVVSRLMPYKNVSAVIEAMRGSDDRLLVVGRGPERHALERDLPENVRILSNLPDAQMRWAYREALALIAPSHEDYGLTPLEAGSWGTPTLALRAGGYLDSVAEGVTGLFFDCPDRR